MEKDGLDGQERFRLGTDRCRGQRYDYLGLLSVPPITRRSIRAAPDSGKRRSMAPTLFPGSRVRQNRAGQKAEPGTGNDIQEFPQVSVRFAVGIDHWTVRVWVTLTLPRS